MARPHDPSRLLRVAAVLLLANSLYLGVTASATPLFFANVVLHLALGIGVPVGAVAEVRYRRFKADEASQAITGPFRKLRPHDNNERQPIHEHRSAPASESSRRHTESDEAGAR